MTLSSNKMIEIDMNVILMKKEVDIDVMARTVELLNRKLESNGAHHVNFDLSDSYYWTIHFDCVEDDYERIENLMYHEYCNVNLCSINMKKSPT